MINIPAMTADALQADGWVLRSDIIWHAPNKMPGSQQDRPTTAHEYVFLLAKQPRYYYDHVAVMERASSEYGKGPRPADGTQKGNNNKDLGDSNKSHSGWIGGEQERRNLRSVWTVSVASEKESHFAVFPPKLILPCILAGTSAAGCCPACRAPYRRQVERRREATRPGRDTKVTGNTMTDGNRDPERHITAVKTTGWVAGCACNAGPPVPCLVLDPFSGSGTTIATSIKKGRDAVGIELSEDYINIARRKIAKAEQNAGFML